jgi:hypothetical protein
MHVHAGHTLRRFSRDGLAVVVSVDGYGPGPRVLTDAVFNALVYLQP